ncbi:FAD-dependent oxidoreductase [bacterium]|nr:MAG: FAD-dependent oxidoreductase [bacterium]
MNTPLVHTSCFFKNLPFQQKDATIILGGGLAGLSAGFVLARAGMPVSVLERDNTVGGLSKTILQNDFRFDLGGHRFFTKDARIDTFVRELLSGDFLTVLRKSKIYMHGKFFDYPLKPSNAVFGLGVAKTLKALSDYGYEKVKNIVTPPHHVSLEDWVVSNFGRTMFNLYFKEYSEKVWGIPCNRVSEEWVSQRIKGLSLWVAIKNAFSRVNGREVDTLVDRFIYPPFGIGQISDRLKDKIEENNTVYTDTGVTKIYHENSVITGITASNCRKLYHIQGREFLSTIPLTKLVHLLKPAVPEEIRDAASLLRYRDLVVVAIMLNQERVTDLTWMYVPEKDIPLGRIHEPKNWSPQMAPEGKTHIVSEYFCFQGDKIWNSTDEELRTTTVGHLEKLGLVRKNEVIGSSVIRVPKAYPVFEVGYTEHYRKIVRYLENFKNLHISGRSGLFRYFNMDHAIESGLDAAGDILKKQSEAGGTDRYCSAKQLIPTPVN